MMVIQGSPQEQRSREVKPTVKESGQCWEADIKAFLSLQGKPSSRDTHQFNPTEISQVPHHCKSIKEDPCAQSISLLFPLLLIRLSMLWYFL